MADLRFAAWAQTALARSVGVVDTFGPLGTAEVRPVVQVRGPEAFEVEGPPLRLVGPDAVAGLDPAVVGRMDPPPGATAVEDNYLASVELRSPELPWLLTPARAGGDDRLRPWIVLVVVEAPAATAEPIAVLDVTTDELPDLRNSWAWAHVQLPAADATPPPGLQGLVGQALARLVCPRRLAPGRHYRACIVPAFVPAGDGHAMAWDVTTPGPVRLPVLHQWVFSTAAESGDFEDLVARLEPADLSTLPGFGARTIDLSDPWPGLPGAAGQPPHEPNPPHTIAVQGAMRPVSDPPLGTSAPPTTPELEALAERLRRHVEAPADRLARTAAAGDETGAVAPPLWGGRHRGRDRVDPPPVDGAPAHPDWVARLNRSVANRIAAGLGAEYVRANQEMLMAAAWDQLGAVREANRLRAVAELASAVAVSTHRRHVQALTAGELVGLAAPAAARARTAGGSTLAAEVAVSPLPDAVASAAFARFLRPAGRVARASGTGLDSVVERGLRGAVQVPAPAPVLARLQVDAAVPGDGDVAGTAATARAAVDGTAAAWQVVRARTVGQVATVNGLGDAGQAATAAVDAVGALDALAVRTGDVATLRTVLAPQLTTVAETMSSLAAHVAGGVPGADGRAVTPLGVQIAAPDLRGRLVAALAPGDTIARRLAGRITMPPALERPGLEPVMASPDFPVPAALTLLATDQEWFVPGVGGFPTNRVTLLEPNNVFIESYLVGLNHEAQRELRWREYPTDGRGTPFRRFWPRPDGGLDVAPMHEWGFRLGDNLELGAEGMAVVLVRGDVIRRFPDLVVAAAPPAAAGAPDPDPASWVVPLVLLRLDESTAAYAFEIDADELRAPRPGGWWFVFQEHSYRIRFGFDRSDTTPFARWEDLGWPSVPMDGRGFALAGAPLPPPSADTTGARWDTDAADVARITLQKPFRVAVHASSLVQASG